MMDPPPYPTKNYKRKSFNVFGYKMFNLKTYVYVYGSEWFYFFTPSSGFDFAKQINSDLDILTLISEGKLVEVNGRITSEYVYPTLHVANTHEGQMLIRGFFNRLYQQQKLPDRDEWEAVITAAELIGL